MQLAISFTPYVVFAQPAVAFLLPHTHFSTPQFTTRNFYHGRLQVKRHGLSCDTFAPHVLWRGKHLELGTRPLTTAAGMTTRAFRACSPRARTLRQRLSMPNCSRTSCSLSRPSMATTSSSIQTLTVPGRCRSPCAQPDTESLLTWSRSQIRHSTYG